ncbi:variable surface lipoprotein [Mycoplasmopsis felifaucium]|uniref:variable surface lipoprotein n=1 Tax=Mycoplasmopsis felifaucium TaxID=35768 RepID=UPI000485CDF5|nr:variable surface lipoprotein [Mycoplasmopsis felifaucium]
MKKYFKKLALPLLGSVSLIAIPTIAASCEKTSEKSKEVEKTTESTTQAPVTPSTTTNNDAKTNTTAEDSNKNSPSTAASETKPTSESSTSSSTETENKPTSESKDKIKPSTEAIDTEEAENDKNLKVEDEAPEETEEKEESNEAKTPTTISYRLPQAHTLSENNTLFSINENQKISLIAELEKLVKNAKPANAIKIEKGKLSYQVPNANNPKKKDTITINGINISSEVLQTLKTHSRDGNNIGWDKFKNKNTKGIWAEKTARGFALKWKLVKEDGTFDDKIYTFEINK